MNFDAVASPALARTHLGARTICIHVSVFLRLRGSQLPIWTFMYEVSGSKPRTASDRGLVESFIETPVIGLAIEIIRPLLSHSLEVDSPANQLQ